MNKGWKYESARHALAAKGVKTGRRYDFSLASFKPNFQFARGGGGGFSSTTQLYGKTLTGQVPQTNFVAPVAPSTTVTQVPVVSRFNRQLFRGEMPPPAPVHITQTSGVSQPLASAPVQQQFIEPAPVVLAQQPPAQAAVEAPAPVPEVVPLPQITLTKYQELRNLGAQLKSINKSISQHREKLSYLSSRKSYGSRAPGIIEALKQEEAQLKAIYDTYTPETIRKAVSAAPKDYR